MTFYLNMAQKYANIRTFDAETGTGSGTETTGTAKTAEELAAEAAVEAAKKTASKPPVTADELTTLQAEKAALAAELEEARAEKARLLSESMARKEKLKAYEGVDPEKYRKLVAEEAAAAQAAAEAAGDFERVKAMMAEAHTAEKTALEAQVAELQAILDGQAATMDKLTVGNAFGTSSFIADKMVLTPAKVRVLYGDHFEMVDGAVVAFDKPKGAKDRTQLVDAKGNPLPFDVALERIVDADPDKKTVLRSRARSGAGSGTEETDKGKTVEKTNEPQLFGRARIAASFAAEAAAQK